MRTLTIAAVQTAPVTQDQEATWLRFAEQMRNTVSIFPHVQLIVVPELLLTAPDRFLASDPDYEQRCAEPIPGPLSARVSALAQELGIWLIPGSLIERGEDGCA